MSIVARRTIKPARINMSANQNTKALSKTEKAFLNFIKETRNYFT